MVIDLDEDLFNRDIRLWRWLNKTLLQDYVFDSHQVGINPWKRDILDIHSFLELENMGNDIKLNYVQGAEEVEFEVHLFATTAELRDMILSVRMDSIRVEDRKPFSSKHK